MTLPKDFEPGVEIWGVFAPAPDIEKPPVNDPGQTSIQLGFKCGPIDEKQFNWFFQLASSTASDQIRHGTIEYDDDYKTYYREGSLIWQANKMYTRTSRTTGTVLPPNGDDPADPYWIDVTELFVATLIHGASPYVTSRLEDYTTGALVNDGSAVYIRTARVSGTILEPTDTQPTDPYWLNVSTLLQDLTFVGTTKYNVDLKEGYLQGGLVWHNNNTYKRNGVAGPVLAPPSAHWDALSTGGFADDYVVSGLLTSGDDNLELTMNQGSTVDTDVTNLNNANQNSNQSAYDPDLISFLNSTDVQAAIDEITGLRQGRLFHAWAILNPSLAAVVVHRGHNVAGASLPIVATSCIKLDFIDPVNQDIYPDFYYGVFGMSENRAENAACSVTLNRFNEAADGALITNMTATSCTITIRDDNGTRLTPGELADLNYIFVGITAHEGRL